MGSANNSNSAARKARIEEMRRAERSRARRNRTLVIAASVVVVAGLVVGGVVLADSGSGSGKKDTARAATTARAPGM